MADSWEQHFVTITTNDIARVNAKFGMKKGKKYYAKR